VIGSTMGTNRPGRVAPDDHFQTRHLLANLQSRTLSSGAVTAGAQIVKFVLSIASTMVLARLLPPEDFGLVSMVGALTSLLGLFKEAGLSTATVQRETISQEQVSNLFWINIALGAIIAFVGMVLALPVAWFYREPRLVGIMIVVSLTFILTGSAVQHQALLVRQMRFTSIAIIDVTSMLIAVLTGCGLAVKGFGYWSLVGMQLCLAIIGMVLAWWFSGWLPALPSRQKSVLPLLSFGAHLTAADVVTRLARDSDSILIGRFWGAEALGVYSRANVLLARPLEQLLTPIDTVLMPALSRLQSDPERYRRTFLRAFDLVALTTLPLTAVLFALAEPIVLILLGAEWRAAAPLCAGFALAAVSMPVSLSTSWLLKSQGRGRDQFRGYSFLSVALMAAFVLAVPWGPKGMVLAFAAYGLFVRLPFLYYLAGRQGPVCTADLWKRFLYHLPCWGVVYGGTTLALNVVSNMMPLLQVTIAATVGLAAGVLATLAVQQPRESALYALNAFRGVVAKA
jgi:PST family polysaccharide transporter